MTEESASAAEPTSEKGHLAFLQKQFEDAIASTEGAARSLSREAVIRRFVAYFLKALAVFGGLVVATGLPTDVSQIIGMGVSMAVAIDAISSNHKRLIIVMEARNAYDRLIRTTNSRYRRGLRDLLRHRPSNSKAAGVRVANLLISLLSDLEDNSNVIADSLRTNDLKTLENLSLVAPPSKALGNASSDNVPT